LRKMKILEVSPHKVNLRYDLVSMDVINSFHARVEINLISGCWIWTGGHKGNWRGKKDYGIASDIKIGGSRYQTAHRLSWLIHYGEVPANLMVCHTCDNPRCCNPDHLFLGTQLENMKDMVSKGRHKYVVGGKSHLSRLNENDVFVIKQSLRGGISPSELAKRFGVSESTIKHIKSGRSWRHIA